MSDNNSMVNIIAPDGTAGQVPSANAQAAINAGGRIGVHVYAPDGTAGFIPHDQLPAAIKAGATATNPKQVEQEPDTRNFFQKAFDDSVKTSPSDGLISTGLKSVASGIAAPIFHPQQTAASMVDFADYSPGAQHADPVQPVIDDYKQGGAAYAGTKLAGNLAGQALLGKAFGAALPESGGEAALTPEEISARQITKAVNPAAPAYQQYLEAARGQIGNVLDYAKRNNIAISGNGNKGVGASLAKVAGLAKDETAAHYETNVLGPNETVREPVAVGKLAGSTPTLRDIDSRITDIADEQRSANRQPTPGQTAGMSDAELVAEKAHLADILHRSLGNLTGTGAEDVQALRQRMAQLSVLSGETQGAANAVTRSAGIQSNGAGSGIPAPTTHGVISHALSTIPGFDPESLQGKAILKALNASPINSTQLLDVHPGANAPMAPTPSVVAFQQQAAQQAALAANTIADQQPVQAAKAAAKVQRTAAQQAIVDKYVRDQADIGRRNLATHGPQRFISTPNMVPK